jgi:hypothetical protein
MTSAHLAFKNFNAVYTKSVNEISKVMQRAPPDVPAAMAFPLIKGFFTVYPEIHTRCLAKCPTHADASEFFDYTNQDEQPISDEQLAALKPIFFRIANTIPQCRKQSATTQ